MSTPTQAQYADAIISNYLQLQVLTQLVIRNPTQDDVDAAIQLIDRSGFLRPKLTTSVDGENYSWTEYQTHIANSLKDWIKMRQQLGGAYQIQTRLVS